MKFVLGLIKTLIGILVIIALIVLAIFLYGTYGIKDIVIRTAEDKTVKQVKINYVIDKITMDIYSLQLKEVEDKKEKEIIINKDIEIEYDDNKIRIDLDNKDYCEYETPNYKAISKMPNGLYDWAKSRASY